MLRNVINLKNGKTLSIVPLDGKKLLINTSNIAYLNTEVDNKLNIKSISFENDVSISIDDEIEVNIGMQDMLSVYKVKMIIVENNNQSVILFSSLPTKTSTFLIPLLNKNRFQLKHDSYFVNAFISSNREYLCLLYRYTGTDLYKSFEEKIIQDKLYIKHLDYDKYHVMYLFKIPDEFEEDIEHFLDGNYSKFSRKLKTLITKFYGSSKDSTIYQIIYKSPKLKNLIEESLGVKLKSDEELASKPILENEIYNLNS